MLRITKYYHLYLYKTIGFHNSTKCSALKFYNNNKTRHVEPCQQWVSILRIGGLNNDKYQLDDNESWLVLLIFIENNLCLSTEHKGEAMQKELSLNFKQNMVKKCCVHLYRKDLAYTQWHI